MASRRGTGGASECGAVARGQSSNLWETLAIPEGNGIGTDIAEFQFAKGCANWIEVDKHPLRGWACQGKTGGIRERDPDQSKGVRWLNMSEDGGKRQASEATRAKAARAE